jgi:hypothetical protein
MRSYLLFYVLALMAPLELPALLRPPMEAFKYEDLERFLPGTTLDTKDPKLERLSQGPQSELYRFLIDHNHFKIPVSIQVLKDSKIIHDVVFTLPTYFLHDPFHQELIKRWGPQDRFLNKNETSVYMWKSEKGVAKIYEAGCSIVCHPISLSLIKSPVSQGLKPLGSGGP